MTTPDNKALLQRIEKFLEKRGLSKNGEWCRPSMAELQEFERLIYEIRDAKWEGDYKECRTTEVKVYDKIKHDPFGFRPVLDHEQLMGQGESIEDLENAAIARHSFNVEVASNELRRKLADIDGNRERRKTYPSDKDSK